MKDDRFWLNKLIESDQNKPVHHAERHELLLRAAAERGVLYLARAKELTGASTPTIRRDFVELTEGGAAERIRGGIRPMRTDGNLPFAMRKTQRSAEKLAIAQKAASLLEPGMVVFVDGGTTTFHLGLCLPAIPLRIITNSVRFAAHLDDPAVRKPMWEIYLTGGCLQPGSSLLSGPGTVHSLSFYRANLAFLSMGGVTHEGLYNTSELVVETERAMIERSDRAVVLADHSKIGKHAMCRVGGLELIKQLITTKHAETLPELTKIRETGIELHCVE